MGKMRVGPCCIPGCGIGRIQGHGMCVKHYKRWYKKGFTELTNRAKGTGSIKEGYVRVLIDGKMYRQHVLLAEKALGKQLPKGAVVHHVDGNGTNNDTNNLVICQDQNYHLLLHRRAEMLAPKFALYDKLYDRYFGWEEDFYNE